jgi:hypothetical protein
VKLAANVQRNEDLRIAKELASDNDDTTLKKLRGNHKLRGPEYANNSCAYDTLSMEFMNIFEYLNAKEQDIFCKGLPVLGAIFKELDRVLDRNVNNIMSQKSGIAHSKELIKGLYFYEGSTWIFNQFTSLDLILEDIIKNGGPKRDNSPIDPDELNEIADNRFNMFVLKYKTVGSCEKSECLVMKENSESIKIAAIERHINLTLLQSFDYTSIQDGLNHLFGEDRKNHRCRYCNESETRKPVAMNHPVLFHLSIPTSFFGTVSTELTILGEEYNLISVEYGNMSHFKCRFLRDFHVYEYDGMGPDGGCSRLNSKLSFPPMLKHNYRACGAWYTRNDC